MHRMRIHLTIRNRSGFCLHVSGRAVSEVLGVLWGFASRVERALQSRSFDTNSPGDGGVGDRKTAYNRSSSAGVMRDGDLSARAEGGYHGVDDPHWDEGSGFSAGLVQEEGSERPGRSPRLAEVRGSSVEALSPKQPSVIPPCDDEILFAESPKEPGIPVAYRSKEARAANPDRLNLDRRQLTECCLLEGEEQLRLLNYQHNAITRISRLVGLNTLVFLDFYSNCIEELLGLEAVPSLRVLMLGRNKISKIQASPWLSEAAAALAGLYLHNAAQGLRGLVKLDVLDLHNNRITSMEGLEHLTSLRILNLAGNQITTVSNVSQMSGLTEVNLRRNSITSLMPNTDVHGQSPRGTLLPARVQRCFLSYNCLAKLEDVLQLQSLTKLSELAMDGNPICLDPAIAGGMDYRYTLVDLLPSLQLLDMKSVTEEERKSASEEGKAKIIQELRTEMLGRVKAEWSSMKTAGEAAPTERSEGAGSAGAAGDREGVASTTPRPAAGSSSSPATRPGGSTGYAEMVDDKHMQVFGSALEGIDRHADSARIKKLSVRFLSIGQVEAVTAALKKLPNLFSLELEENGLDQLSQ
ncbi:hypothetical protein CYMTET_29762, partial [Cymbomonas tetramitiformis]